MPLGLIVFCDNPSSSGASSSVKKFFYYLLPCTTTPVASTRLRSRCATPVPGQETLPPSGVRPLDGHVRVSTPHGVDVTGLGVTHFDGKLLRLAGCPVRFVQLDH